MGVRAYLGAARRWWWTVVSAMVAASISGYLAAGTVMPTYEAETRLLVGPVNAELDTLRASALIVETYAELVQSDQALLAVAEDLGLEIPVADLRDSVRATANTITRMLTITVESTDPNAAADIANRLADDLAASLGPAISPSGRLVPVDRAVRNPDPIAPNVLLLTALSAGAGFVAAVGLVLLMERFSSTINSRHDLVEVTGAPLLGIVSLRHRGGGTQRSPLLVEARPSSQAALSIRLLAGKLSLAAAPSPHVIVILATEPGGAAGELAANLAGVLDDAVQRVILVDADDDESVVTRLMGEDDAEGVSEILDNSRKEGIATRLSPRLQSHGDRLWVLPQGQAPHPLADDYRVKQLVAELRRRSDRVVVSAGALHRSPNAAVWAGIADLVVLAAERDAARRSDLRYAIETLRLIGCELGGVVLIEHKGRPIRRRPRSPATSAETGRVVSGPQAVPADLSEASSDRRT